MKSYSGIERRRSPRVKKKIKAIITCEDVKRVASTVDISCHGLLLKTRFLFKPDKVIKLSLKPPVIGSSPLSVEARIVRVVAGRSRWGFLKFNVGVEFEELVKSEKEKIKDVINVLKYSRKLVKVRNIEYF